MVFPADLSSIIREHEPLAPHEHNRVAQRSVRLELSLRAPTHEAIEQWVRALEESLTRDERVVRFDLVTEVPA